MTAQRSGAVRACVCVCVFDLVGQLEVIEHFGEYFLIDAAQVGNELLAFLVTVETAFCTHTHTHTHTHTLTHFTTAVL